MARLPATLDLLCPYCKTRGISIETDYDGAIEIYCANCTASWLDDGGKVLGPDPAKPAYADATNPDVF